MKYMIRLLCPFMTSLIILLSAFPLALSAQEDVWDVYIAQYDEGPGSTLINMSLKQVAPLKQFPFVLITGVKVTDCTDEGFPTPAEFQKLYVVSDSVQAFVNRTANHKFAGTFTYQCERLDYFYITDTAGIRKKLQQLYASAFPSYQPYINIRHDASWEAYLDFLYPNEVTYEYMLNQKVVMRLEEAGDKLEKERQVDHWLYFKTEIDRECFVTYATKNRFTIISKSKAESAEAPYQLVIVRNDKVTLPDISALTLQLRKQAVQCNGTYDGWETLVVKE